MKLPARSILSCLLAGLATVLLASCGSNQPSGKPDASLNVLELGATYGAWSSLDPTSTVANVNHDFLNAIYGELFSQGRNGRLIPQLATGFKVEAHGLTVKVALRRGVRFSDGSPFNAQAVAYNIRRDLSKATACECAQNFAAVTSVSAAGNTTVALHLSRKDPALINAFIGEAPNWIASPTALKRMSRSAFALAPVGAGPFTVTADTPNTHLTLAANPRYWQKGHPKLTKLTFTSVANDASAYETMAAGQAQVYMDFANPALLAQMKHRFNAIPSPATQTEAVNLNPRVAPFTNPLAREAVYYATNPSAIDTHVLDGDGAVAQTPGGPADLFWSPKVVGYRSYDPTRARALVRKLHGLTFTLTALATPFELPIAEALQSEWRQVGIKAHISILSIPQAIQQTQAGTIQALQTKVGSYDPALLPGIGASYASTGPFSLVKDPNLDQLISSAGTQTDPAHARKAYGHVSSYLNQNAYAIFLFTTNLWNITARSVHGISPGAPEVAWQNVWIRR